MYVLRDQKKWQSGKKSRCGRRAATTAIKDSNAKRNLEAAHRASFPWLWTPPSLGRVCDIGPSRRVNSPAAEANHVRKRVGSKS